MRYIIYSLFALILSTSCSRSATKINASIKATHDEAMTFNNLSVLAMLPNMSNRAGVEIAMDDKLRELGIKSMTTFDVFPFAGNKEVIDKMELKGPALRKIIREKVAQHEIDALMTITLMDTKQEERYVEGSSFTVAGPAIYSSYPEYGYHYYDYYSYAYATVYDEGYYTTSTTYFLEINLYDIATEKLIWTGQTETKNPTSVDKEAKNFAELIVNELIINKVIKK